MALVAAAFVALVTAGCERWVRRRGGMFRWRIIDFGAAISAIAIVLGYVSWANANSQRDARTLAEIDASLVNRQMFSWDLGGPQWLHRLLGTRDVCNFPRIVRVNALYMGGAPSIWTNLGRLTALRELEMVAGTPSKRDFEELLRLKQLETLSWAAPPEDAAQWLPRLTQLKRLSLYNCDWSEATVERLRGDMPGVTIGVLTR